MSKSWIGKLLGISLNGPTYRKSISFNKAAPCKGADVKPIGENHPAPDRTTLVPVSLPIVVCLLYLNPSPDMEISILSLVSPDTISDIPVAKVDTEARIFPAVIAVLTVGLSSNKPIPKAAPAGPVTTTGAPPSGRAIPAPHVAPIAALAISPAAIIPSRAIAAESSTVDVLSRKVDTALLVSPIELRADVTAEKRLKLKLNPQCPEGSIMVTGLLLE